ncbi:hypothetical protein GIB67_009510 [Kingdonia uniflora]|uniref:Uncharacterized protein n=1 Tax=Kingdonia uniflora TaxID=39325 RepID=A0A7J7NW41_9MAGN|nr:hypothetical protein GIB67_009510 [Kingdonia uniflora]
MEVVAGEEEAQDGMSVHSQSQAPPSSASSLPKESSQVELELRVLEALEIYPIAKLKGIHRHFVLYGLTEFLRRSFDRHFSPDEVLQLLDSFYNLDMLVWETVLELEAVKVGNFWRISGILLNPISVLFGSKDWNLFNKLNIKEPIKCCWVKPPDGSLTEDAGGFGALIRDELGIAVAGRVRPQSITIHELQGVEEVCIIVQVFREANAVADNLAKIKPAEGFIELLLSVFSSELSLIIEEAGSGKIYLRK